MSSQFQGLVDSQGSVLLYDAGKAEVPDNFIAFRGLVLDADGFVAALSDTGQPRIFQNGLAFDADTGQMLTSTGPIANRGVGGLSVSAGGAVVISASAPDVIHQGVGLMDDGSLCGVYSNLITNGDFSDGITGWTVGPNTTVTFPGSWCQIENAAAAPAYIGQILNTVAGVVYRVTLDSGANNGSTMKVNADSTGYSFTGDLLSQVAGSFSSVDVTFTAAGTQTYFSLYVNSATIGRFVQADNVVVKKS